MQLPAVPGAPDVFRGRLASPRLARTQKQLVSSAEASVLLSYMHPETPHDVPCPLETPATCMAPLETWEVVEESNSNDISFDTNTAVLIRADVNAAAGAAASAAAKVGADMDASAGNGASPSGDVDTSAGGGLSVNGSTAAEEAAAKSLDLVKWPATSGVDPALEGVIKAQTIAQIKRWFSHQKTMANRESKNPFMDWLDTFERLHVPRKLPLHKFYMQWEEYAALVKERFNEKWPLAGLETNFALDFCCKCAKELLDDEEEEVRAELAEALDAEHEAAMAEYHGCADAMSNPEAPSKGRMDACRTNLATVAQPFLDGIAKLTGFHVTLLAGAGPPQGSERLHAGRTVPIGGVLGQKFSEWDMMGFKKNVLGQFMRYLLETNEHSATREVPGTGGVTWAAPPLPAAPANGTQMDVDADAAGSSDRDNNGSGRSRGGKSRRAWAKAQERLEVAGRDPIPSGVKKVIARKYVQPEPQSSSTAQPEPRPSSTADAVESYTQVSRRVQADAGDEGLVADAAHKRAAGVYVPAGEAGKWGVYA
ncbi:hypothetical protein B0H14DRAFT_3440495 [Mycena olivaceomarginata]|nr:hypothetical protein B0H14DRAFT_3440495 [Mycena olivaceomarginata]